MYNYHVITMSVSEARAALPALLDRVLAGTEVTITRHGEPVAVVVRPDVLRTRRADQALADAERVRDLLATGRTRRLDEVPTLNTEYADQLITQVRASRAGR